ncbi:hypothetical protein C7974DRAFT_132213 [Boeremia exigua]|uniref:uncharacterized protein n=1 Tax=Boeremia exigua TaxID=749465 RepID=UPI001E8E30FF|nr:uncharacterized protein C7974DRAFT_132213 [Boeremia exigua]KAH6639474.1 hypothetical protein C7974DRAFT_132213 [Boeremia exigua]
MDSNSNSAITGHWYDYAAQENFLSVENQWSYVIMAAVAVWLSWSVKYVKKILGNIALWLHLQPLERSTSSQDDITAPEAVPLMISRPLPLSATEAAQSLAKIYKETGGIRDLFWMAFANNNLDGEDKAKLKIFSAFVAAFGLGMIIAGYFAANVRAIGPVILDSPKCGLWVFNGASRSDFATRAGLIDLAKEERAAEYAEACYHRYPRFDSRRCNFFYSRKLVFGKQEKELDGLPDFSKPCPFKNDICRNNRTVTFTTTLTDASELGINSPTTHSFRRSTTCSPLKMDYPFIQNSTENGTTTYKYYYGEKPGADPPVNYTYSTTGDPWQRLAPVYDVFAYNSASDPVLWEPLDDLAPSDYSTVTIIFVSSLRILYEKRSDDPIFPADESYIVPGDPTPWFKNSDPRARPFACVNQIEVCTHDEKTCFPYRTPDEITGWTWTPEFTLLFASLDRTDIYDSIRKRQGRALKAQKVVSSYFSGSLGDRPWVDEVQNMVATAHARTQINAWSIARGEDSIHEEEGYVEITKGMGNLCGQLKYNPQGYASLNFTAFLVICLLPPTKTLKRVWSKFRLMLHPLQVTKNGFGGSRSLFTSLFGWSLSSYVLLSASSYVLSSASPNGFWSSFQIFVLVDLALAVLTSGSF